MKRFTPFFLCGIIAGLMCGFFIPHFFVFGSEVSDVVDVELQVRNCNNNNICEAGLGENAEMCPLDCGAGQPTEPPSGGGGTSGSYLPPIPFNVRIEVGTTTATITWETNQPTFSVFFWGETVDLEKGSLSELSYQTAHSIHLTGLTPETAYYFRIFSRDSRDIFAYTSLYTFTTLKVFGAQYIDNIKNLHYSLIPRGFHVQWENPLDPNFSYVRVMRSPYYYPRDPLDGTLVYEGRGNGFDDTDIIFERWYYYTAFAVNIYGEYSPGVLLRAYYPAKAPRPVLDFEPVTPEPQINIPGFPGQTATATPGSYLYTIDLNHFIFTQRGVVLPVQDGVIQVRGEDPIEVTARSQTWEAGIKQVSLHLQDPLQRKNYISYLLGFKPAERVYRGLVDAIMKRGNFPFTITIFDYQRKEFKEVPGVFQSTLAENPAGSPQKQPISVCWLLLALLLVALLIVTLLHRNKGQKNDPTSPQF